MGTFFETHCTFYSNNSKGEHAVCRSEVIRPLPRGRPKYIMQAVVVLYTHGNTIFNTFGFK